MRKFIAIFMAAAMLTAALTACSSGDVGQEPDNSSSTTPAPAENEGDSGNNGSEGEGSGDDAAGGGSNSDADVSTAEIVDAIKGAYDDIPFIDQLPEEMINDRYGLDPDSYTEITAHVPLISTFVDTVVVVKAADGKAGDVEAALKAYHTSLVEESIQYPMNIEKVNAAQVVTKGNYVAFIMLGAIDEREGISDSERVTFAQEQIQIGVDAFNAYLT